MMKFIIIAVAVLLICGFLINNNYIQQDDKEDETMEEPKYQGPVRPTDDEEHFRKTGVTRPLEEKDG